MRRAGLQVTTVGIGGDVIVGAHGIAVQAYMPDTIYRDSKPEMIILPGGMPGASNLDASKTVESALRAAVSSNAYLAAICAAPMILGKRGYLQGKRAICFPGFENQLQGAILANERVVTDGRVITAAGMGVALEFGLALVAAMTSSKTADSLRRTVLAD